MLNPRVTSRETGFTLIELLVTITIFALLMALGMPSMTAWIRNTRLRTAADSLQDGLRTAQAEALRRSRQVVFSLTDDKPTSTTYTAKAGGKNWAIKALASMTANEVPTFVEAGILSDSDSTITITGPASVCFSSIGRLVANPTADVNCVLPTTTPPVQVYAIKYSDAQVGVDRPLQVTVALGGQVRMCDPAKTLDATHPDGCPAP